MEDPTVGDDFLTTNVNCDLGANGCEDKHARDSQLSSAGCPEYHADNGILNPGSRYSIRCSETECDSSDTDGEGASVVV